MFCHPLCDDWLKECVNLTSSCVVWRKHLILLHVLNILQTQYAILATAFQFSDDKSKQMRKNCNFGLIFIWNERAPPTGLTSTQSFTWLWFSPVTVLSSPLYLKLIGLKRQWHQITINYMNILLFQGFIGRLVEILRPSHSTNSLPFNNKEKAVTFLVWFTVYRFFKLDLRFSFIFCISLPIMIVWMLSKHSSCCWVVKSKYIESKKCCNLF